MTFTRLLALVGSSGSRVQVRSDSRSVGKGDCFVALAGGAFDGHDFIGQAVDSGAAYIVCQKPCDCGGAELVVVENSSKALGLLAQAAFGNPSSRLTNLAVTGTNGKTTVGYLVRSIIQAAGEKCGLLGTIVYDTAKGVAESSLTTPDALCIAGMAGEMVAGGAKFMMIEASSHALSQGRLWGINFTAAAFTNLTGDHLDYHKTAEAYLDAKSSLFEQLPSHAIAVLNADSEASREIADRIKNRTLWYAIGAGSVAGSDADITARIQSMDTSQTVYTLGFGVQKCRVVTTLPGRHNVSNQLAAAGLCIAAGFDLQTIAAGLSEFKVVPGRLEPIDCGQDFSVFVDYAHTDDALKNVLGTLRPLCEGRLIVVFGCGGERDRTKRPRMAKVAEELSDVAIVTSDNPRGEKPGDIIADITAGFSDADSDAIIIEADRKKAIELAIEAAGKNDIVLIAGKGHETYQTIGDTKIDFDDRLIAREILQNIE